MHLTVGIFGNMERAEELARKLGKAGTKNDIAIFNHASSEGVLTFVTPASDKIQVLLQSLNMIDIPVLAVNEITKEVGEIIIALDQIGFDKGFIVAGENCRETLKDMLRGTILEKFPFIEENSLRIELIKIEISREDKDVMIPIDNYFDVRSVGTVILGIIKSGTLKKYDKLFIEPIGKEVLIKGIQSQDNNLEYAEAGMRVGLNLKGIEAEEIKRGYVICKSMKKSHEFSLKIEKSGFFKQELKPGMQVCLSVGLQAVTCIMESIENGIIKFKALSPIAYKEGQKFILASLGETIPRIIGSGRFQ